MGSEGQQDMEMAILTALLKGELSGGRGGAGNPVSLRPRGCWEPGRRSCAAGRGRLPRGPAVRSCSSGPSRVGLGAGVPEGAHGLRGWHQHRFPWVAAHRGFRFAGGEHRRPFPVAAVRDCSVPRSSARLPAPRLTAGCELAARGCSGTGASCLLCGCVGMGTAAAERRASPEGWLPGRAVPAAP